MVKVNKIFFAMNEFDSEPVVDIMNALLLMSFRNGLM